MSFSNPYKNSMCVCVQSMAQWWNGTNRRLTKPFPVSLRRNNLRSNPGLRDERPATNTLSQ